MRIICSFIALFFITGSSALAEAGRQGSYQHHLQALQKRMPSGFTAVVEPPFIVVGNDTPEIVRRRARSTVRWAVDHLKESYFDKNPDHIIEVWLFKDRRTYEYYTKKLFKDEPDTPFGYYSPRHRALIMNIATGGGTLVHEIVHPFMAANFPDCPAWFNEGLGSLYEQSGERDGKIIGQTNWRLAGLQEAIEKDAVPSFKSLMSTTENQFYGADPGTNYAQSRYLLYYLQERGLLRKYYKTFYENRRADPTGYRTLKRILGTKDMTRFQRRWERYVLTLRFP